jgi:hypothetical protein
MYLAQSVERVEGKQNWRYIVYRVRLNDAGRSVWQIHRSAGPFFYYEGNRTPQQRCRAAAKKANPGVPFIQAATPGKLVTASQASTLTGIIGLPALDYLTESVSDSPVLQNYVKPKPVKEEKPEPAAPLPPTPVEIARGKLARALAKEREWTAQIAHADAKRREWRKKRRYQERRIAALEANQTTTKE